MAGVPTTPRALSDHRALRQLDRLILFWVVLWVVIGVATGVTLWRAAVIGDTVSRSGGTIATVGESLQALSDLPLVPDRPGEIGQEVQASAADISARGQDVKGDLRLLGVLLGIAVIGIPLSPVVGLYLPLRLRRSREVRALRESLRRHPDDPGLDGWLAHRARGSLVYDDVARIEADAGGDPRREARLLADAELRRLGVRRPSPAAAG